MLIVREMFVAKPGQASKLAKLLKDAWGGPNVRVMTDVTGGFNTIVMESEAENLSEFEARMKQYAEIPSHREKMKGYTEMYLTGQREIFRLW